MAANGRSGHSQGSAELDSMTSDRLDSWKEIASYLRRSVRTVTRWEREEGLPVHRHVHSKAGSVFAYKTELDAWWTTRGAKIDRASAPISNAARRRGPWLAAASVCLITVIAVAWSVIPRRAPYPTARLVPLTTYPGVEGPPTLSPDGNQVAFARNGDIFVKQVDGEALVQLTSSPLAESAPAWSPDGRQIAFRRGGEGIFVISPLGGGERKIATANVPLLLDSLTWTPDARSLVVSEMTSPVCASLFVIAVGSGEKRRLTSPIEPTIGDGWPAVSPDGTMVAFARYAQDSSANIHVVLLTGGEPRRLTSDSASVSGIAWSGDSEVVFASDRSGTSRLWRISTSPTSTAVVVPVGSSGEDARFPTVSHATGGAAARLAYQRFMANIDIRRIQIANGTSLPSSVEMSQPFIASTRSDDHPAYSPDGRRIAFVSRRSGTDEIWVCQSDASNPVRLTSMGGPIVIAPRWSPDGRRVAFFAATGPSGAYRAYIVSADGGEPMRLTKAEREIEALPSWSRDGRWIYLTSGRSGSLQIWKVDVNGENALQLTRGGGAEALESPDGTAIYYAKVPEAGSGLWSVSPDGRNETQVIESVRFGYWGVLPGGIYFVDFDVPDGAARPVRFFNFRSRTTTQVGSVEATVAWHNTPGFAVSPDGRWLLYSSLESSEADLMLVENFR
jgi:Tol biopolymer transport system component